MRVTKEWLIETISRIPDGTEMDITGHDHSLFVKLDPDYKEPERVVWPEPYESERIRIQEGWK